ncbi:hypothetical protein [Spiroplasma taiwanense]|uniref:Uncharacterized protein n=1 Tax=Spiroplasma taiwanense CT-1 TaxID=1276220 RepID=S5LZX4_9MOLU|nr:hypothetical protein [Spiroplasma taiwanense]AGR41282.1 hypothetical protein STAIW_v1c06640 [Spiroplasma taiwanense CT-1]
MFYKLKSQTWPDNYSTGIEGVIINVAHIMRAYKVDFQYIIVFQDNSKISLMYNDSKNDIKEIEKLMNITK